MLVRGAEGAGATTCKSCPKPCTHRWRQRSQCLQELHRIREICNGQACKWARLLEQRPVGASSACPYWLAAAAHPGRCK